MHSQLARLRATSHLTSQVVLLRYLLALALALGAWAVVQTVSAHAADPGDITQEQTSAQSASGTGASLAQVNAGVPVNANVPILSPGSDANQAAGQGNLNAGVGANGARQSQTATQGADPSVTQTQGSAQTASGTGASLAQANVGVPVNANVPILSPGSDADQAAGQGNLNAGAGGNGANQSQTATQAGGADPTQVQRDQQTANAVSTSGIQANAGVPVNANVPVLSPGSDANQAAGQGNATAALAGNGTGQSQSASQSGGDPSTSQTQTSQQVGNAASTSLLQANAGIPVNANVPVLSPASNANQAAGQGNATAALASNGAGQSQSATQSGGDPSTSQTQTSQQVGNAVSTSLLQANAGIPVNANVPILSPGSNANQLLGQGNATAALAGNGTGQSQSASQSGGDPPGITQAQSGQQSATAVATSLLAANVGLPLNVNLPILSPGSNANQLLGQGNLNLALGGNLLRQLQSASQSGIDPPGITQGQAGQQSATAVGTSLLGLNLGLPLNLNLPILSPGSNANQALVQRNVNAALALNVLRQVQTATQTATPPKPPTPPGPPGPPGPPMSPRSPGQVDRHVVHRPLVHHVSNGPLTTVSAATTPVVSSGKGGSTADSTGVGFPNTGTGPRATTGQDHHGFLSLLGWLLLALGGLSLLTGRGMARRR